MFHFLRLLISQLVFASISAVIVL